MANDNNKIKGLHNSSDEDDTTEFAPLRDTLRNYPGAHDEAEVDEDTFDFERLDDTGEQAGLSVEELHSDIRARNENISRLQFDIEQLRARWIGLEAEISAREALTNKIQQQLTDTEQKLSRTEALLSQRDRDIDALQAKLKARKKLLTSVEQEAENFSRMAQTGKNVVSELQNTVADQQSRIKTLQNALDEQTTMRQQSEARSLSLRQELDALASGDLKRKHDTDKTSRQNGRLENELRDAKREIADNLAKLSELNRKVADNQSPNDREQRQRSESRDAQLAQSTLEIADLRAQMIRTEGYADELRRQQQDLTVTAETALRENDRLQRALRESIARARGLSEQLEQERLTVSTLQSELEETKKTFQEELRQVRFELGGAQNTIASQETINEQLASDLFDHQGFRQALENQIGEVEEANEKKLRDLRRRLRKAEQQRDDTSRKLENKDSAIAALLAELASRSHTIESIGEIENVIHEIDGRMSSRIEDRSASEKDRTARLLIGNVDGRDLQFPLFKERLTIGRTSHNDIQLKAQFISRRHALIITENEQTKIVDWGSKNGVYVNDSRIVEHNLQHGDVVAIGTAEFRYEERPKRN